MDVVVHPRFQENRWVYLTYHKPVSDGSGVTTLARGNVER
ncbi:MAG: PQQ-dependent sugar dehydrogenase [Pirellulaceae bacterium]